MRILTKHISFFILLLAILSSCRHDEFVSFVTDTEIITSTNHASKIAGMYVLCEGNMGANKCTLDYLDLDGSWTSSDNNLHYLRNIYAQQNPSTVMELGDVGNDIQIYGNRLWIVVNCSNKVEVCQAKDARRIGQVSIPNARYVTFHQGFAYVSSYVGGIAVVNDAPLGCVYKVDTLTLQKVDSVLVGYQPEEMAVSENHLFVANSGGYRAPLFDHTVSIIDLSSPSLKVTETIDVAPNLHHMVADRQGKIWVTSRGDYATHPARLHSIDAKSHEVKTIDLPVASFSLAGDTLFCLCQTENEHPRVELIDTRTNTLLHHGTSWLNDAPKLSHPYGIIANPETRDFYLMDAKNYVSSGELLHFTSEGRFDWCTHTGDIPSRAAFVYRIDNQQQTNHSEPSIDPSTPEENQSLSCYISAVDEYVPAPGQFVNTLPIYEIGDDQATMAKKCFEAIGGNRGGLVTLGNFGGYITFHFDHPIENHPGEYDLQIFGNATINGSEPGIVMVSVDENANGLPDDPWYELSGSADLHHSDPSPSTPIYNYSITYQSASLSDIPWTDNLQHSGLILRNEFHTQPYYPLWLLSPLTFTGTRLPDNAEELSDKGSQWVLRPFKYGYVDNVPNQNEEGNSFDLSWAVDPITRQSVQLKEIHFIRVYSAMNQTCGWLGETSTEISGAKDLHYKQRQ